jgi:uncharacterized protein YprB with RNaseH-like and TPR domain
MGTLTPVAVDIETTGFDADEEVTVVGFAGPDGCHVYCQTDERDTRPVTAAVEQATAEDVTVSVHPAERAMLMDARQLATKELADRARLLVAYNGETRRGGFDLPFLRSRAVQLDVPWLSKGMPYADLYPMIRDRFSLTVDRDGRASLEREYDVLVGGNAGVADPFDDSVEAVTAFERGDIAAIVQHNLADVRRTAELAALAERYCSTSDFAVKSLTPVRPHPPP